MRKSKYLGMTNGDWTCTHVGVARVQPALTKKRDITGRRMHSRNPGHQTYYYIFERRTSGGLADKMVRLNASQIRRVFDGWTTVESVAELKKRAASRKFTQKVSYALCD
jgi:hypothetical protein